MSATESTAHHGVPSTWCEAAPPDLAAGRTTGRLRSCSYCGSMHPADVAAAIRAGAMGHWADRKYGWPHKAYFDSIPNPHAGMLESRMGASHAVPNCPFSLTLGGPCEHKEPQSFSMPQCMCMQDHPDKIVGGRHAGGNVMIPIRDGFSRETGKPVYRWTEVGKPAAATTWGKFYSVHLQDATPEDRKTIELHLGYAFSFKDGSNQVSWRPAAAAYASPQPLEGG